jgi:hypothetical protein
VTRRRAETGGGGRSGGALLSSAAAAAVRRAGECGGRAQREGCGSRSSNAAALCGPTRQQAGLRASFHFSNLQEGI